MQSLAAQMVAWATSSFKEKTTVQLQTLHEYWQLFEAVEVWRPRAPQAAECLEKGTFDRSALDSLQRTHEALAARAAQEACDSAEKVRAIVAEAGSFLDDAAATLSDHAKAKVTASIEEVKAHLSKTNTTLGEDWHTALTKKTWKEYRTVAVHHFANMDPQEFEKAYDNLDNQTQCYIDVNESFGRDVKGCPLLQQAKALSGQAKVALATGTMVALLCQSSSDKITILRNLKGQLAFLRKHELEGSLDPLLASQVDKHIKFTI